MAIHGDSKFTNGFPSNHLARSGQRFLGDWPIIMETKINRKANNEPNSWERVGLLSLCLNKKIVVNLLKNSNIAYYVQSLQMVCFLSGTENTAT